KIWPSSRTAGSQCCRRRLSPIWRRDNVPPNLRGSHTRDGMLPCTQRNEGRSTNLHTKFLKEAHEIVGMFFLHGEDGLHQTSGRGIVVAEVSDHIAVAIDGDALSDQILFDHVDQRLPFHIL